MKSPPSEPVCTADKSKVEISQNFVAFSEYMNFNKICPLTDFIQQDLADFKHSKMT